MPSEITMPQLSDTMTEGTIVKWLKKEGDKIKSGDVVAEVETDKATMEMESFEAGTLAYLAAKEGQKVAVGKPLGVLATGDEKAADVKKQYASGAGKSAAIAAPAPQASAATAGKPVAVASSPALAAVVDKTSTLTAPADNSDDRLRISPVARRIAAERGIDLATVSGTGPNGRIIQQDILNYQPPKTVASALSSARRAGPPAIDLSPKIPAGQTQNIPLTKMRTVIAQRLQQAKQAIPHFYETIDVDVEDLSALRVQMNSALESHGIRLSLGDLIAKAITHALLVHPALNAHFKENTITRHGDVNLGMAVALDDGLIVPVLRGINHLSLRDIRQKSEDLVDRARKQNLKQNEMTGATFTVSNLGTYGVREFVAVINPPEVAILAVGAAEQRPVVRNGQIISRLMMSLTLSADHRAVDGATAAQFLQTLKVIMEAPGMMLV